MRVAIYARKSTESEDRQIQSLDDQLDVLLRIAASEGYDVVKIFEESKSAKDPGTRPEFTQLMKLVESDKLDGILVWNINRLSRNMVDGGKIAHLLHAGRLRFIKTPDRIFRPEDNVILFAVENASATNFIHELRKNVERGMNSKAQKGWFPGRAPLGYRNNIYTHEIEPDPERFHLVRAGWDMILAGGCSLAEVYRALVESGLTMYGRGQVRRDLRQKSAYDIYSNVFYTGQFVFQGKTYDGAHKPMITRAEFDAAQKRLASDQPRALQRSNRPIYSGIFTCVDCGCQIVADIKRKTLRGSGQAVEYAYYRCSGRRGCTKNGIREEVITERVLNEFNSIKLSQSYGYWCKKVLLGHFEKHNAESAAAIADLSRLEKETSKRLDSLTMFFVDGEISKGEYQRNRQELSQKLTEIQRRTVTLKDRDLQALEWINSQIDLGLKSTDVTDFGSEIKRTMLAALGGIPTLISGSPCGPSFPPFVASVV